MDIGFYISRYQLRNNGYDIFRTLILGPEFRDIIYDLEDTIYYNQIKNKEYDLI